MAGLDFKRGTDLFLGTERELAMALGIGTDELQRYRRAPREAPASVIGRLGAVLMERGKGMARVGEMLRDMADAGL